MKISTGTAATITAAVKAQDTPARRERYIKADLSWKRYRWDCLWNAHLGDLVADCYRAGCNDDHLDTVLRRAIPDLNA